MKKVSVLMALYHPNREWLKQQLKSLENQTYAPIEVLIIDDGPDAPVGHEFIQHNLSQLPFEYHIHNTNCGSSHTFTELVAQARGEYIAFCDQDDVWKPEKISVLVQVLEETHATATYCTMSVINDCGEFVKSDIRKIRRGDCFLQGENIAAQLLVKNCIYGCSFLMRTDLAKAGLPKPNSFSHDHWFSLWAAINGKLIFTNQSLVCYRVHSNNQSTPLRGIECKTDYEKKRLDLLYLQMEECLVRLTDIPQSTAKPVKEQAMKALRWVEARKRWLRHDVKAWPEFWKGRTLSPRAFWVELILPFLPDAAYERVLRWIGLHG